VIFAVRRLRCKEQIGKRLPVDATNLFQRPVMTQRLFACRNSSIVVGQGRSSRAILSTRKRFAGKTF
jgi:hypothetical protein